VNRTFTPGVRRLRGWVDSGAVGLPRHVAVEFLTSTAAMARDVEVSRLVVDPALSGGGEIRNFLGYAVDAIRYLTGLEIVEVYGELGTLFDGPHGAQQVEDTGIVSMLLSHGVTATATISRCPAVPTIGSAHSSIRMVGSHGRAEADDEIPRVLRFDGSSVTAHPLSGGGAAAAVNGFFEDLTGRLKAGIQPEYGAADAWAGVAVTDALYRSTLSGRSEPVARKP
jgi:myo-inositol 2-dehydrogenase / D-chiro-inositol 1-dehydrogenase